MAGVKRGKTRRRTFGRNLVKCLPVFVVLFGAAWASEGNAGATAVVMVLGTLVVLGALAASFRTSS